MQKYKKLHFKSRMHEIKYDLLDSQNRYAKDVAQTNLKFMNTQKTNVNFMNNFNELINNNDLSDEFSSLIKLTNDELFIKFST